MREAEGVKAMELTRDRPVILLRQRGRAHACAEPGAGATTSSFAAARSSTAPATRGSTRDVAVKDGRIAAVGSLAERAQATRVIDATGKIVTPGFIDLHSHADGGLATMELRHSPNMVAQGITLSVVNQDGRSPRWPIRDQKALYEKQGIGTNAALLVGHGTVRTRVMGNQRDNQVATDADIHAMQKLVEEGMADGAFGLSSGLEYDPGRYSRRRAKSSRSRAWSSRTAVSTSVTSAAKAPIRCGR